MSSIVCRDRARKTPSGPEEGQQGLGVASSKYGSLSVLGSACRPQQGHQVPPTNRAFIKKFCVSRQAQGETPQQPGDGRQRETDAPPSPLDFTSAHPQKGLSIAYTTWPTLIASHVSSPTTTKDIARKAPQVQAHAAHISLLITDTTCL